VHAVTLRLHKKAWKTKKGGEKKLQKPQLDCQRAAFPHGFGLLCLQLRQHGATKGKMTGEKKLSRGQGGAGQLEGDEICSSITSTRRPFSPCRDNNSKVLAVHIGEAR